MGDPTENQGRSEPSDSSHPPPGRQTTMAFLAGQVFPPRILQQLVETAPPVLHNPADMNRLWPLQLETPTFHSAANMPPSRPIMQPTNRLSSYLLPPLMFTAAPRTTNRKAPPSLTSVRSHIVEFPARLHALLSLAGRFGNIVGWTDCGTAWTINSWTDFCVVVLPILVGGSTRAHYILCFDLIDHWGFQRRELNRFAVGYRQGEDRVIAFHHDYFLRDFPRLLCALKPASPLPSPDQENHLFQPISRSNASFQLSHSLPTEVVADYLLHSSSSIAPFAQLAPLPNTSTGSAHSRPGAAIEDGNAVQAKPWLGSASLATSQPSRKASKVQHPVVRGTKQQRSLQRRPTLIDQDPYSSSRPTPAATAIASLGLRDGFSISSSSTLAAVAAPPAKRRREPSPQRNGNSKLDQTQHTKKKWKNDGKRRKWLPPLGPPDVTNNNNVVQTGGNVVWYCGNPETFADFAANGAAASAANE